MGNGGVVDAGISGGDERLPLELERVPAAQELGDPPDDGELADRI